MPGIISKARSVFSWRLYSRLGWEEKEKTDNKLKYVYNLMDEISLPTNTSIGISPLHFLVSFLATAVYLSKNGERDTVMW